MAITEKENRSAIDDIVSKLGIGKFQLLNYSVLCLIVFITSMSCQSFMFTSKDTSSYRCLIPECESSSSQFNQSWLNKAIPMYNGIPIKCERYGIYNISIIDKIYANEEESGSCSLDNFDNRTLVKCQQWIYSKGHSICKEFAIPCEDWKLSLVGTFSSGGQLAGLLFSGAFSDKYGRRIVIAITGTAMALSGLIQSLTINYWFFITFEFFTAAFSAASYTASYIVAVEILSPQNRIYGASILSLSCSFGYIALGFLAWILKSRRNVLLASNLPGLVIILSLFIIPESFRWLNAKGKKQDCINVLKRAASMNKKIIPEGEFLEIKDKSYLLFATDEKLSLENDLQNKPSLYYEIISSSVMLLRLIICSFCWFSNVFVFYGLALNSLNISDKADDIYINYICIMCVDIFGVFLALICLRFINRKYSIFFCLMATGVACITCASITNINSNYSLIIYSMGRMFNKSSFINLYMYTSEIFPTELRNSIMNSCSVIGRFGGMIAPQVPLLSKFYPNLPMLAFGIVPIISAITMLKLPKTSGKVLPDTIQEAKSLT